MTPSNIAEIRKTISRTREALTSSADPSGQISALESVIGQLQGLDAGGVPREEIAILQNELRRVEVLVQQGDAFWRNCSRWIGLDTGYTPLGVVAPVEAPARLKVEG